MLFLPEDLISITTLMWQLTTFYNFCPRGAGTLFLLGHQVHMHVVYAHIQRLKLLQKTKINES